MVRFHESTWLSMSFIAHTVLHASTRIRSGAPVQITSGEQQPHTLQRMDTFQDRDKATDCWAILLETHTASGGVARSLVPVQLVMHGGPVKVPCLWLSGVHCHTIYPLDMPSFFHCPETAFLTPRASTHKHRRTRLTEIPKYADIFAKFQYRPCLRCSDVELYERRANQPDSLNAT